MTTTGIPKAIIKRKVKRDWSLIPDECGLGEQVLCIEDIRAVESYSLLLQAIYK